MLESKTYLSNADQSTQNLRDTPLYGLQQPLVAILNFAGGVAFEWLCGVSGGAALQVVSGVRLVFKWLSVFSKLKKLENAYQTSLYLC